EVIGNTDPLDKNVPGITKIINNQESRIEQETPWAWYISRASGLMAYFLLWWVMFFGLAIRTPILKSVFVPIFSLEIHCWLSLQSLFFVFFHAGSLLVDKYLNFNVWDIIVPFHSQTYTSEIALGILGLYLMAVLIITSYFKNIISQKIWRSIHWMNIVLFAIVTIHAFFIGTDLKNTPWLQNTFIGMNIFLIFIIIVNLSVRLKNAIFSKKA
ncbi:MAG TPA: hypothetical protein DIC35_01755, partial [Candidatus Moranbacteria bacterium]|nr:hypothetical protein [Candidatus Moranbacteria bacterium]